jgi:hypothetical protein
MTEKSFGKQVTEMITITKSEYYNLIEKEVLLSCLENRGVENWDGYDEAIKEYRDWLSEQE